MNTAQEIIIPAEKGIFRTIFLNVGQGDSTLLVIPEGDNYKFMLVDCNIDENKNEIDLVKMFKNLLGKEKLDYFLNTHPHKDHLEGIEDVHKEIGIKEVWHSGHKPKGKHSEEYKQLKSVIDDIGEKNVFEYSGTRSLNTLDKGERKLGDITYHVIAPAEHVCEDIEEGTADQQYARIHEYCGVIKFSYGETPKSILITGDAEHDAWSKHITDYHKKDLKSEVLSASHHGSRTFFMEKENGEAYTEHIENIAPDYIIVSAPKQKDSPHDHPHDDAMKLYKNYVDEDNLFHLGENNICVIVDIDNKGNIVINIDTELVGQYGFGKDNEKNGETKKTASVFPTVNLNKSIDQKQFG